jgi:hypothetical protein
MYQRFLPGQRVSFTSLTSKRVFRAYIIEAIGDGFYYWIHDGTGTPRIVRGERLRAGPSNPTEPLVA